MRHVHREATERVGANQLGRNGMRGHVHREGFDGTSDGNKAWRTAERRKRPCVRPAMFETGSCSLGGVWRTAKRRKQTSYGRNGGHVDREGCVVPQNGGNGLVLERYGRNGGPVHQEGCGVPQNGTPGILFISTVDLLQPPWATVDLLQPPRGHVHLASTARYSTGYCSTTPPRAPLHRLLFIQPSIGLSCSSSPPRGPIHPAPTGSIDWGPVHPEAASIGFS